MIELVILIEDDCGYLPMLYKNGIEVCRGEYQADPKTALDRCLAMVDGMEKAA